MKCSLRWQVWVYVIGVTLIGPENRGSDMAILIQSDESILPDVLEGVDVKLSREDGSHDQGLGKRKTSTSLTDMRPGIQLNSSSV